MLRAFSLMKKIVILQMAYNSKIFVRDEVHFDAFYERKELSLKILDFLKSINADLFLPIYANNDVLIQVHGKKTLSGIYY